MGDSAVSRLGGNAAAVPLSAPPPPPHHSKLLLFTSETVLSVMRPPGTFWRAHVVTVDSSEDWQLATCHFVRRGRAPQNEQLTNDVSNPS